MLSGLFLIIRGPMPVSGRIFSLFPLALILIIFGTARNHGFLLLLTSFTILTFLIGSGTIFH